MLNDTLIIESIQQKIDKLNSINNLSVEYNSWYDDTLSNLKTVFDPEHHIVLDFINCSEARFSFIPDDITSFYKGYKFDSISFLTSVINQIKTFGLTAVKGVERSVINPTRGINITNNLHNSQQQSQNISFELLKDILETDLDDEQKENLKSVLSEYKSTNNITKAVKFIKTLGDNVLANIVSSIILNPNIINQLITYLSK
jgi:hypothetical protein